MKRLLLLIFLLPSSVWAQGLGREYYEIDNVPWNGDWLNQSLDQMVHGEYYLGYPGPLPKLYASIGLDEAHPAIDYELLKIVDRDAPHWHGSCNGWAAAALLYPTPESIVINGVKIFSGDLRALLASIWKDNVIVQSGELDDDGITAAGFEQALYFFVAQNRGIIFDIATGEEAWNYPVGAFERVATENGDWVDVEVTVYYSDTMTLTELLFPFSDVRYRPITYTYRYSTGPNRVFEWTGNSVSNRPHRAWYANQPYFSESWNRRANRHVNMDLYNQLLAMDEEELIDDLYEPNATREMAANADGNLVMASAIPGDTDFFRVEKAEGEALALDYLVYDGPKVAIVVSDNQGNELGSFEDVDEGTITLTPEQDGPIYLQVTGSDEEISFYQIQQSEDRGWLKLSEDSPFVEGHLTAINTTLEPAEVTYDAVHAVNGDGSHSFASASADGLYRSTQSTVWAAEKVDGDGVVHKEYFRGHPLDMPYVVPHVTCRNGWKTILHLSRSTDDPVAMEVYQSDGSVLVNTVLPQSNAIDLGSLLGQDVAEQASWFQLKSAPNNQLHGRVTFAHDGIGYHADFDIRSRPRNGQTVLTDLPGEGEGWVGISIANISGVTNEILYRLVDNRANVLEEGQFFLASGERWLGLPSSMVDTPIMSDYKLYIFSQFDVETLALRHDTVNQLDYAHRLFNETHDFVTAESFLTPPSDSNIHTTYVIHNIGNYANWIRFRGYKADGTLALEHRVYGRSIRAFENVYLTFDDLMAQAEIDAQAAEIAHFKLTSSREFVFYELVSRPGQSSKTFVQPASVYQRP